MPDDRLFHRRAGHSAKVTSLTDLEFRVWWTYVLAADDYGVMRASPVVIQAANDALASKPAKAIERALKRLVDVALLAVFVHQHNQYVCQLDWQDFQGIRYPRTTTEPSPPPEILQKCSRSTAELFRKKSGNVSEEFHSRGGDRETANGKRLTANGSEGGPGETAGRRAPLHDTSHRKHAECGRICLHGSQFDEFVRRRNHPNAEAEISAWAHRILQEWAEKPEEPGDPFDFWRARYDETWPAVNAGKPGVGAINSSYVQRRRSGQL